MTSPATAKKIEGVLRDATGDPSSGPIAEWIPAMARAVAAYLAPAVEDKPSK